MAAHCPVCGKLFLDLEPGEILPRHDNEIEEATNELCFPAEECEGSEQIGCEADAQN